MIARQFFKLALIMPALTGVATPAYGIEVTHLSTIRDGLTAPTSICISADKLAVLEPFTKQLTVYTADGILRQRVDIDGNAVGLSLLSTQQYIYIDHSRRCVSAVDILTGDKFDFFTRSDVTAEPTDLLVADSSVFVLDAGLKSIVVLSTNGVFHRKLLLQDSAGTFMGFPSSFAYNQSGGQFLVLDQLSSKVWAFSAVGTYLYSFGTFGGSASDLTRGGDIACDSRERVFLADRYQGKVLIFRSDGQYLDQFSLFTVGGPGVLIPIGMAIDEQGLAYVASLEAARIDIFRIGASGTTIEELLVALPVTPLSADTVDYRSVSLVAHIDLPSGVVLPCRFDFQLFLGADTSNKVAEGLEIVPVAEPGDSQNLVATWRPLEQFRPDTQYQWRVRVRSEEHLGAWSQLASFTTTGLPLSYHLYQNYPNPFNPSTRILFATPRHGQVSLTVYNLLGQSVITLINEEVPAGEHQVTWTGVDRRGVSVASGMYFYRLVADSYVSTKKMVLVK
ncbi:MAG: T9SS type A sorting domain-containing protein [Candidatus Kerfeldbacteria bacterium]|nr:T9SS type A sorting domain-containing protein [Candidatus Kerfeldbacteria bacterium]